MASPAITDRALRYRAQKNAPDSERICCYCGAEKNIEVEHIDGFEEHTEPDNLTWACRSCNTAKGIAMRNAGMGRRTRQRNPAVKGATTLGEWVQAVGAITPHKGAQYSGSLYGLASEMPVSEAVAIIRATSPAKRSEFASKLRKKRRNSAGSEVKKSGRAALKQVDRVTGAVGRAIGGVAELPRKWAGSLVGEKNPKSFWLVESRKTGLHRGGRMNRIEAVKLAKDLNALTPGAQEDWRAIEYSVNPSKFDRCVKDVKRRGGAGNAYAVCTAAGTRGRKNPKNPRNPADEAARGYEAFHGKPAEGETIIEEELHVHKDLWPLGILVDFHVATITGLDAHIATSDPEDEAGDYDETAGRAGTVFLAANEAGTQLFFRGGDQALDLDRLKFKGDWVKDDMIIGVIYEITYRTRKKFDKFKLTDYYHGLGEDTGDQPFLRYDPLSPHLYITGGKYKIKLPLVGVSPGIEN